MIGGGSELLWWSLIIGADLGGNGTIIGSASNIVALEIARDMGYDVSFKEFFETGFKVVLLSTAVSSIILILIGYLHV